DDCLNTNTASQVIYILDKTAPVIDPLPGPSTNECPAAPIFAQAHASDACGSGVHLSSVDVTNALCGSSYRVTRNWTAYDDCLNTNTASQVIYILDKTAPVIDPLPGPSTNECPAAPLFAQAHASDACGSGVHLSFVDVTNALCGSSYRVTRNWTAYDDCLNTNTASQV